MLGWCLVAVAREGLSISGCFKRLRSCISATSNRFLGFEGATLQRTADQADINLGMIHHYIGRKTDLLDALVNRLIDRTKAELAELNEQIPAQQRLSVLLETFFEEAEDQLDKLIEALYVTGHDNPTVEEALKQINQLYADSWAAEIGRLHPDLPAARCMEIAFTVLSLAYARDLMQVSQMGPAVWRKAAETLIHNP